MANNITKAMVLHDAKRVQEIVERSDYAKCPVPDQKEVQKFTVNALTALLIASNGNGSTPHDDEPLIKTKWFTIRGKDAMLPAFVIAALAALVLLVFFNNKVQTKQRLDEFRKLRTELGVSSHRGNNP